MHSYIDDPILICPEVKTEMIDYCISKVDLPRLVINMNGSSVDLSQLNGSLLYIERLFPYHSVTQIDK